MKVILAFLALVFLTLVFAFPAKGQEIYYASLSDNLLGQTVCEGQKIAIIIQRSIRGTDKEILVIRHENVHVKQIRLHGCEELKVRYATDPDFRFNAELEAYCPDFKEKLKDEKEDSLAKLQVAFFMWYHHGKHLSKEEAVKRLDACLAH